MNVLSILGGPKEKGSSGTLLSHMEKEFSIQGWEITRINTGKLNLKPCYACEKCYRDGTCVTKDEMADIFKMVDRADIVLSSAPIFFATVPAQFKILMDRCQVIWAQKYKLNHRKLEDKQRLGYFIATGGAPENTIPFNCLKEVMDLFYKAINIKYLGDTFVGSLDKVSISQRRDIFEKVEEDVKKLIEIYHNPSINIHNNTNIENITYKKNS